MLFFVISLIVSPPAYAHPLRTKIKASITPSHSAIKSIQKPNISQTLKPNSPGILDAISGAVSYVVTLGHPVQIVHPQEGFSYTEKPEFLLSIPQSDQSNIGVTKNHIWKTKDEAIQATIVSSDGKTNVPALIKKDTSGTFIVTVQSVKTMRPGTYHVQVLAQESFLYTRDLSQDFQWGVLAVNTDKSVYTAGETVDLAFGIVDNLGHTLCHAPLDLTITDPDGNKVDISTENGKITRSPKCAGDSYLNTPDYFATYQTNKTGVYQMVLTGTNDNGTHTISDYFVVRDSVPFVVNRSSFPSRIYPVSQYPVSLTITANQDYSGIVSDTIPQAVKATDISDNGKVQDDIAPATTPYNQNVAVEDKLAYARIPHTSLEMYQPVATTTALLNKTPTAIVWQVDWHKGQTYTLTYTLNFPPISPEYYVLGPFTVGSQADNETALQNNFLQQTLATEQFGDSPQLSTPEIVFQEMRQWQIASDATKCWIGAGGGTWSTAGNWSASGVPGSGDTATFDHTGVTCASGTNTNSTIDGSYAGDVGGINIKSTYSATITQAVALTIEATGNYSQAAGIFTGATQAIDNKGTFSLTGGTFTSTTGTLTLEGSFTNSGTFAANGGSISFDNGGTITGSSTGNNVEFTGCDDAYSLASGTVLTVNGTFTMDQACANSSSGFNGPGGITALGDISVTNAGIGQSVLRTGNLIITVAGTGTQTITGDLGGNNSMSSLTINKPSGTLNFVSDLFIRGNLTYTAGTINAGTSTIIMDAGGFNGAAITISGSMTLNNFGLISCANPGSATFQAGTVITVNNLDMGNGGCGTFNTNGPGTINAQGNVTEDSAGEGGNLSISLTGSSNQTWTQTASTTFPTGNFIINKTGGTVTLASAIKLAGSGQQLTLSGGTLDLAGNSLTVNSTFTVNGSATLKLQGAEISPTQSYSIGSGSTVNYTGSGTYAKLGLGTNYGNLTFSGTGSWTDATASAVLGSFTQSGGTVNFPSGNLTIGGNFTHTGGSSFNSSNTVIFNDNTQTSVLSGATTFDNLSVTTAGKTITLPASTTETVSGALTLIGGGGSYITLNSSSPGTQATLTVNGSATISKVNVSYSNACSGSVSPLVDTSDGDKGNNSCWSFTGAIVNGAYKQITLLHSQVTGTQINFPVLISETSDSDLVTHAKSDGSDIYFKAADQTTALNYEIEHYNSSTGEIEAWVEIPSLSSSADTIIYMYYGDGTTRTTPGNPWDSNYVLVNHLGETSGTTIHDSSTEGNNGTKQSSSIPLSTTGEIDGAQSFNGSSGGINSINSPAGLPTGDFTMQLWMNTNSLSTFYELLDMSDGTGLQFDFNDDCSNQFEIWGNSSGVILCSSKTISTSTWYYVAITRSGSSVSMYVNPSGGTADATTSYGTAITYPSGCGIVIGAEASSTSFSGCNTATGGSILNGKIDEVRMSNIARSSTWIQTEYNNQSAPGSFETIGSQVIIPSSVDSVHIGPGVTINHGVSL